MPRDEELRMVVEELVRATHQQTKVLERLIEHLGQTVGKFSEATDLSLIGSELAALHVRAKRLVAAAHAKA